MEQFKKYSVYLLKDYHPEGYEDEWVDAGTKVFATLMPHRSIYLEHNGEVFKTDAKEKVDFRFIQR